MARCRCPEPLRRWAVIRRRWTRSAFDGYRVMPSEYSDLLCFNCDARWRTKALYVDFIRDIRGELRWLQETATGGRWVDDEELNLDKDREADEERAD